MAPHAFPLRRAIVPLGAGLSALVLLILGTTIYRPAGRGDAVLTPRAAPMRLLVTEYRLNEEIQAQPHPPAVQCNYSSLPVLNSCLAEKGLPHAYPGFLIVGWPKASTTSLLDHLAEHPEIIGPTKKEPNFFDRCGPDYIVCPRCRGPCTAAKSSKDYIENVLGYREAESSGFTRSTFEASVGYAQAGAIYAGVIRKMVPGVKIVASLREPISRLISHYNHVERHNLVRDPQRCNSDESNYMCLKRLLQAQNYSVPLAAWIKESPAGKIFLIQHEQLAEEPEKNLHALKAFLGVDPSLPKKALVKKSGHTTGSMAAFMSRAEYEDLIGIVKPDVDATIAILAKMGHDVNAWRKMWSAIWNHNLDACSDFENCRILASI